MSLLLLVNLVESNLKENVYSLDVCIVAYPSFDTPEYVAMAAMYALKTGLLISTFGVELML